MRRQSVRRVRTSPQSQVTSDPVRRNPRAQLAGSLRFQRVQCLLRQDQVIKGFFDVVDKAKPAYAGAAAG